MFDFPHRAYSSSGMQSSQQSPTRNTFRGKLHRVIALCVALGVAAIGCVPQALAKEIAIACQDAISSVQVNEGETVVLTVANGDLRPAGVRRPSDLQQPDNSG